MSIFVYGDESGVFDAAHHDVFVFGGLVFSTRKLATPNIAGSLQLKENLHRSTVPQIATSNSRHAA